MNVFWDTNVFIHLWESGPLHPHALSLHRWMKNGDHTLLTSCMTLGELLVKPMREGRIQHVGEYQAAFQRIQTGRFSDTTAILFARIRSQCTSLKPPDAIQLACAVEMEAEAFISHDLPLQKQDLPLLITSLTDWQEALDPS